VRATLLSMIGWATFALLWLVWFCERHGIGGALARLARVGVLTAVAFPVLYAYYAHSGLLAAGIEVDAGYTFLALHWFVGVANPITYAGRTTSFAQFPFALLTHLPATSSASIDWARSRSTPASCCSSRRCSRS
jgi:hypothetical protein